MGLLLLLTFLFSKLFVLTREYRSFTNRNLKFKRATKNNSCSTVELLFFLSASALEKPQDLEGKSGCSQLSLLELACERLGPRKEFGEVQQVASYHLLLHQVSRPGFDNLGFGIWEGLHF